MRILFFLMLCMSSLSAQKVGVVDVDSVLLVMPEQAALDSIMTEVEGLFILHIAAMGKKMEQTYRDVMSCGYYGCGGGPKQGKRLEDSLRVLQEEYETYLSRMEDFQFTLERKIKDYQDRALHGAIYRVAMVGNYQYILTKETSLYYEAIFDVTTPVINELAKRPWQLVEQNITLLSKEVKRMIQEHFLGKEWLKN